MGLGPAVEGTQSTSPRLSYTLSMKIPHKEVSKYSLTPLSPEGQDSPKIQVICDQTSNSHVLEGQIEKTNMRNGECLLGNSMGNAATKTPLMPPRLVTHKLHVPALQYDATNSTFACC